jgi:GTPase SAR1 family protein
MPNGGPPMRADAISRFKKYAFLLSLSEDDFRDRVVRPLFFRLGYQDGRDLCGPQEAGKDALFFDVSRLGIAEYIAVQTKKGPLNLASKATANVAIAITQLQTALTTPFSCVATRKKIVPDRVILCASGKINDSARHHILEVLKVPTIQFLDVDDLIPKIDDKLPELWLDIDADLIPYFRAIKLIALGQPTGRSDTSTPQDVLKGAASDDLFVPLKAYRRVLRRQRKRGKIEIVPEIQEIPVTSLHHEKSRRILLLGDAGAGKSTALLRIAYLLADRGVESDGTYTIPLLLRATDVANSTDKDLVIVCDEISRSLSNSQKPCFTKADLEVGRVVILLDSLDEVPSNQVRSEVLQSVKHLQTQYPKVQVIVGSRPYRFTSELDELKEYSELRISPMNWKQAERIILAVQRGKSVSPSTARDVLRRIEKVHGIELNPLLVTVFAATNEYTKQDIPANITELFKKFTELMLGRWDEQKGLKHLYHAPLKDFLLKHLAFRMHSVKRTSIARHDAEAEIAAQLRELGHDPDIETITKELFERSGLFRIIEDSIEFRHLLLQEFFAGRAIASNAVAATLVTDEWWKRALVFYFGENPDQVSTIRSLMSTLTTRPPREIFEAATTLGLAIQACYLSPVTDKTEAWKWVVDALCATHEQITLELDPHGKQPLLAYMGASFYARDSVALASLASQLVPILAWVASADDVTSSQELRMFWTIVGLIESAELVEAERLIREDKIISEKLLAIIHLGCTLAHEVRPLEQDQKSAALQICHSLSKRIEHIRQKIIQEFGSELLEMRDGKVEPIESAEDSQKN